MNSITSSSKWEDLDIELEEELIQALKRAFNFEFLMPVQKAVIPLFAKSFDVAVEVFYYHKAKELKHLIRQQQDQGRHLLFSCLF